VNTPIKVKSGNSIANFFQILGYLLQIGHSEFIQIRTFPFGLRTTSFDIKSFKLSISTDKSSDLFALNENK
jgi:hypothetical protein